MPRRWVPFTGEEKESLHVALDRHREAVLWKLEGLDDAALRREMTPPSGTNLLGLVKHLAAVEYGWFCETFGRPTDLLPSIQADETADMSATPDETTEEILAFYAQARAAADRAIKEIDLEETGTGLVRRPGVDALGADPHGRGDCQARRHADILRELIDGMTGDHRRD